MKYISDTCCNFINVKLTNREVKINIFEYQCDDKKSSTNVNLKKKLI